MTRQKVIKEIEKIKDLLVEVNDEDVSDYAREKAYIKLDSAIEYLEENEEI